MILVSPVILHSDLNAFYASVECLCHPELRDKPVAVCGSVEARHGIVLAKNQLAKMAGVKTGQVLWEAKRLCPGLQAVEARHGLYLRYARAVRAIYARFTDRIEPFGLDEAWLDVTGEDGKKVADDIRRIVKEECGLTASVGVSDNKIYAKLGSDYRKPDATTVFLGDAVPRLVYPLPASDLLFVGPATAKRLALCRVNTIGELAAADPLFLKSIFGKIGPMLSSYARGEGGGPVMPMGFEEEVKSIGHSTTLPRDLHEPEEAHAVFSLLSEAVAARLREHGLAGRTVAIYLRKSDLSSAEHRMTLPEPSDLSPELLRAADSLLPALFDPAAFRRAGLGIRSLGLRVASLSPLPEDTQLTFDGRLAARERMRASELCIDSIRRRFGYFAIRRAAALLDPSLGKFPDTHFSALPGSEELEVTAREGGWSS